MDNIRSHDQERWARGAMIAACVAVTLLVYVYPLTLRVPLLDPDEGLHAAIAQEMIESGDWIVPRLLGEPFLDKPVLYFWAQAASLLAFGHTEIAVRLPGVLFALLGVLTTGLLARRVLPEGGTPAAITAAMFYATMFLPAGLTQVPVHDVALVPCINLAFLALWRLDELRSWRRGWPLVMVLGLLFAGSFLVKGFVGIAILGVGYGGYFMLRAGAAGSARADAAGPSSHSQSDWYTRRFGVGSLVVVSQAAVAMLLGAAFSLPWYLAVEADSPGFLYYYFVERHLLGFATRSQLHSDRPFWYYVPLILGGGLPWIAYLPLGWRLGIGSLRAPGATAGLSSSAERTVEQAGHQPSIRRQSVGGTPQPTTDRVPGSLRAPPAECPPASAIPPHLLLWCWFLGGALLLSAARSKMVTYIWPLFPAVAIVAAVPWVWLVRQKLSGSQRNSFAQSLVPGSLLGPVVVPLVLLVAGHYLELRFSASVWIAAACAGAAAWLPLACFLRNRLDWLIATATVAAAVQLAVVFTIVLPMVGPGSSARGLAAYFNRSSRLPPQVLMADERIGSLIFYLDPPIRAQLDTERLKFVKLKYGFQPQPGAVLFLPENVVDRVKTYVRLEGLPFERVDRYRRYDAAAVKSRLIGTLPPRERHEAPAAGKQVGDGPLQMPGSYSSAASEGLQAASRSVAN
ncbi:MAG: ArnT family glycosyltransferase [Planctomycetota bacterium]